MKRGQSLPKGSVGQPEKFRWLAKSITKLHEHKKK